MTGRGTFVPLVFESRGAFQFDCSEDWAVLGGERVSVFVNAMVPPVPSIDRRLARRWIAAQPEPFRGALPNRRG